MGTYCTVRDVRNALTPSGDETNAETGASLPDWQIEDAIDEAEGHINSFLSRRYTITPFEIEMVNPEDPLETWVFLVAPSPVRAWTRNIAAYLAALTYRKNKDLGEDDPIRLRYNLTMNNLREVRDGRLALALPTVEQGASEVAIFNLYEGHLFDESDFNLGPDTEYKRPQIMVPLRNDR